MIKLYDYWRSTAAYRLRIAFKLKGLAYESISVNLHPEVTEHKGEAYRAINPQGRVPAIAVDGQVFTQSMAILEWLDETYPMPALLPEDPALRLRARAFAQTIVSDVHPLNNPIVLGKLRQEFGAGDDAIQAWYASWIKIGFAALEEMVSDTKGPFLFGETPSFAEICLIPQMYNAWRFKVDVDDFPRLCDVDSHCRTLEPFAAAAPEAVKPQS